MRYPATILDLRLCSGGDSHEALIPFTSSSSISCKVLHSESTFRSAPESHELYYVTMSSDVAWAGETGGFFMLIVLGGGS